MRARTAQSRSRQAGRTFRLAVGMALAYAVPAALHAAAPGETARGPVAAPAPEEEPPSPETGRFVFFPPDLLYPPSLASEERTGFGLRWLVYSDPGIADSGSPRADLRLGGRFGLVRLEPRAVAGRPWQLDIEAGFNGQFDSDHSLDNIGWDGIYGLWLTGRVAERVAVEVGVHHTSSHVGDEYAERTGRRRIGYTRGEAVLGISVEFAARWRVYGEGAYAYELRTEELQEPGRLEAGIEYEAEQSLWRGRLGWYAAADLSAVEERGWQVDPAVQIGLVVPSDGRRWRLSVSWYDGRVPIGEFFQDDETYVAFGLWLDP